MSTANNQRGMTLVEVLAALALLSMLVAATSSLTGYIARTSAERQAEASARSGMGATVDLITADLDAWIAALDSVESTDATGGERTPMVATANGVELEFPAEEGRPQRTIAYGFDELTGRLTRADSSDAIDQPRDVMGGLTRFDVSLAEAGGSDGEEQLLIEIATEHGITRSIAAHLPPEEVSDD